MKQQDFKLETILTATTGINFLDDFNDMFELAKFIYMDPLINTFSLQILKKSMKNHILEIHPELEGVCYDSKVDGDIDRWLAIKKVEFGDTLPICVIGHTLTKKGKEKVKSNDEYFQD